MRVGFTYMVYYDLFKKSIEHYLLNGFPNNRKKQIWLLKYTESRVFQASLLDLCWWTDYRHEWSFQSEAYVRLWNTTFSRTNLPPTQVLLCSLLKSACFPLAWDKEARTLAWSLGESSSGSKMLPRSIRSEKHLNEIQWGEQSATLLSRTDRCPTVRNNHLLK